MDDVLSAMESLIRSAVRIGCDSAEAFVETGLHRSALVRKGRMDVWRHHESSGLALRLFSNRRTASGHTTDLAPNSLKSLLERTKHAIYISDPDDHNMLAPECSPDCPDLDLCDPRVVEMEDEKIAALTMELDAGVFEIDPRVVATEGAVGTASVQTTLLLNSSGFFGRFTESSIGLSVSPVAEVNGRKSMGHGASIGRHLDDLRTPTQIARQAVRRATDLLDSRRISSGRRCLILDTRAARVLLQCLVDALNGDAVNRRHSFLWDRFDQDVASRTVTVIDDGRLRRGIGSRPFDGEGVATGRRVLVHKGRLVEGMYDVKAASVAGRQSTGHAVRHYQMPPTIGPNNLYVEPGKKHPEQLVAETPLGLLVTGLLGFGFDVATGTVSFGAEGRAIEGGQLTHAVSQVTVASNLGEVLVNIEDIGNDLDWQGHVSCPTLKVKDVMVSGA